MNQRLFLNLFSLPLHLYFGLLLIDPIFLRSIVFPRAFYDHTLSQVILHNGTISLVKNIILYRMNCTLLHPDLLY